jgi:hypothetical protein
VAQVGASHVVLGSDYPTVAAAADRPHLRFSVAER